MRVKIIFSYDGSRFSGFQRQNDERSVQKTIEDALTKIYKKDIVIKGAGRTDAGVHADGQVAHFDVDDIKDDLLKKLNYLVNPDIVIKKLDKVSDDFHARQSALKKEYIYKIYLGKYKSSLRDYMDEINYKIDISLMREASKYLIGVHDFKNFVAGYREDYTSCIYSITFNKFFDKLEIRIVGTHFYRYMVRNIVGALLEVGKLKVPFREIEKMVNKPNEERKLPTASPEGLYLHKIWY